MSDSAGSGGETARRALQAFLRTVEAGDLGDPLPVVAYLAGRTVALDALELNAARRRALLLRAAGGDPTRPLDIDDRAVKALALELDRDDRRAALRAGLDGLAPLAHELPALRDALVFLAGDLDLAWRLFMLGLLAEELDDDDDGEESSDDGG